MAKTIIINTDTQLNGNTVYIHAGKAYASYGLAYRAARLELSRPTPWRYTGLEAVAPEITRYPTNC